MPSVGKLHAARGKTRHLLEHELVAVVDTGHDAAAIRAEIDREVNTPCHNSILPRHVHAQALRRDRLGDLRRKRLIGDPQVDVARTGKKVT